MNTQRLKGLVNVYLPNAMRSERLAKIANRLGYYHLVLSDISATSGFSRKELHELFRALRISDDEVNRVACTTKIERELAGRLNPRELRIQDMTAQEFETYIYAIGAIAIQLGVELQRTPAVF